MASGDWGWLSSQPHPSLHLHVISSLRSCPLVIPTYGPAHAHKLSDSFTLAADAAGDARVDSEPLALAG